MYKKHKYLFENDYLSIINDSINNTYEGVTRGLSIIIPTYNRFHMLSITLACLCKQISSYKFEVIIADDGSEDDISSLVHEFRAKLDIFYVRQEDFGYRLSAVRNLGMQQARYPWIAILDCDMAPGVAWVESYCQELNIRKDVALIGHREYIKTDGIGYELFLTGTVDVSQLKCVTSNSITHGADQDKYKDWRLDIFKHTNGLLGSIEPYRYFSGGNVAFHKLWLNKIGGFDENFTAYGGEDNEFAYRLFRAGCFFKDVEGAIAYHQEPLNGVNETDRLAGAQITKHLIYSLIPPFRIRSGEEVSKNYMIPFMSVVLITSLFAGQNLCPKLDTILLQKFYDIEVCVFCSTPSEFNLYKTNYKNNQLVKVFLVTFPQDTMFLLKKCKGHLVAVFKKDFLKLPENILLRIANEYNERPILGCYSYHTGFKSKLFRLFSFLEIINSRLMHGVMLQCISIRTVHLISESNKADKLTFFNRVIHQYGNKNIYT